MSDSFGPSFKLRHAGDGGLVVELGDGIDASVNAAVVALADTLSSRAIDGVIELIPTYRSLLIQFDPLTVGKATLAEAVEAAWGESRPTERRAMLWHLPVCYGGEHGMDLASVALAHDMDEAEVIARHAAVTYRIYMMGFAPGFAYLGGLDPALHTSRRAEPRLETPPRSVSIGGRQAAVAPPLTIPSGWHMLGRTAVKTYDPSRRDKPFLFAAGDFIRFHRVGVSEYQRQVTAVEAGERVDQCEATGG